MEKDKLNLQIVSMRKLVNTKRKLVKIQFRTEIRKLLKRIEEADTEERKQKLNKQVENKKEAIKIVGDLTPDAISKVALVSSQNDLKKIVLEPTSDLKNRCVARLALKPDIQKTVIEFRKENPGWDKWLPATMELWEKTKKNKPIKPEKRKTKGEQDGKANNQRPVKKKKGGDGKPTKATPSSEAPTSKNKQPTKKGDKTANPEKQEKIKQKKPQKKTIKNQDSPSKIPNGTQNSNTSDKLLKKAIKKFEKKTGKLLSPQKLDLLKKKLQEKVKNLSPKKEKKVKFQQEIDDE